MKPLTTNLGVLAILLLSCPLAGGQSIAELGKWLGYPTDKFASGVKAGTPLKEALARLVELHPYLPPGKDEGRRVRVEVDVAAFRKAGFPDVESLPVQLPPVQNVRLGQALQGILDELEPPAVFTVRKDVVLIVPGKPPMPIDLSTKTREGGELAERLKEPTEQYKDGLSEMTLQRALDRIGQDHRLVIAIYRRGFKDEGRKNVGETRVSLAPTPKAPLAQVLQQLLKPAGATYVVQDGFLLIIPTKK
jgi:hypothetical protein